MEKFILFTTQPKRFFVASAQAQIAKPNMIATSGQASRQ
ncbi:hypothetical protein MHY1_02566 [Methylovirgula sp. HY1]|nr:hypothetical protein MHY1_02566 [Methylovirgula sp. HY1]